MANSERHFERLIVSPGAIVSLQEACELLPLNDAAARHWLHEQRLVRLLAGRHVVCWADVAQALRSTPMAPPSKVARSLPRIKIDPL